MDLALAGYGNNLLNLIIRPAGRSRSFKWVGRGNLNSIPYVPRPIFIPRWIPKERPEYVAKWVPTTPGPQTNVQSSQSSHQAGSGSQSNVGLQSSHQTGFGPPKTNSVVQEQSLSSYGMTPPPPVPQVRAPTPSVAPIPPPIPQNTPASPPSGYAAPHADDILPSNNGVPSTVSSPAVSSTYVTDTPVTQPNVIPETAIRNIVSNPVPQTLGEPSFSALVQDEALAVDLNGFQPVDPNSIIIIDDEDLKATNGAINVHSDLIITDNIGSNVGNSQPFTLQNSPEQDLFIVTGDNDPIQTVLKDGSNENVNNGKELLFVVDSDSSPPVTTPFTGDQNLQSLQHNAGKSFDTPLLAQLVDPIQSNVVSQQSPEAFFIDVTTHTSQPNTVNNIGVNTVSNGDILITQDEVFHETPQFIVNSLNENSQTDVNSQIFQDLQLNQNLQTNIGPQFIIDSEPNQVTDSVLLTSSEQGLEPQHNSVPNDDSDIFLVNNDSSQQSGEFSHDQVAQFSNFQLGQKVKFRPLPVREHGTNSGSLIPSLQRPALVAPPVSPVVAAERSFTEDSFRNANKRAPSGRSISAVIPQPVPIPIGPLASLTLDFPSEGPGVRQARVDSSLLPFGTRLFPRPSRHFKSRAFLFG